MTDRNQSSVVRDLEAVEGIACRVGNFINRVEER